MGVALEVIKVLAMAAEGILILPTGGGGISQKQVSPLQAD